MELILKDISKKYGSKQALDGINCSFENGVTGLLGPNGAGKSTLMRLMATVEMPSTGEILWDGINIAKNPAKLRRALGYLPQDFGVYPNMNPLEFLEYMASMKNLSKYDAKKRIEALLESLHLTEVKKRRMGGFSGGMKQRVGIAQALLNDPMILIVDEPTVGLDPEERIVFRNLLSELGENRIIVLSTHIVTDIESIAPNILVLKNGKLLADTTPESLLLTVDGKVWEMVVSSGKLADIQKSYLISGSIQKSDGIHIRIISTNKPSLEAVMASPSLEDAYLYSIKESR